MEQQDLPLPAQAVTVEQLDKLVDTLAEKRFEKSRINEDLKEKNKEITEIELKIMGYLEELDKKDYRSNKATVSEKEKYYVTLPDNDDDDQALKDHLREVGLFDKMCKVNSQSLNAYYRAEMEEHLKNGGDPMTFNLPGLAPAKLLKTLNFRKR